MNTWRSSVVLWGAFFLASARLQAQPELSPDDFHVFSLITSAEGLPGRTPVVMTEDALGFQWIGGDDGLARFDGNQFRRFKRKEGDAHSLPDNRVRALLADEGRLWIGTAAGLCYLDLVTERFVSVVLDTAVGRTDSLAGRDFRVNTLHKDPQGRIWIGSHADGFGCYLPASGKVMFYTVDRADIPADHDLPGRVDAVMDFEDDSRDPEVLWVGLYGGLLRFDKRTGQRDFHYFRIGEKEQRIGHNAFRRILMHADGMLYAGAWGSVWQVFDPATGVMTPLSTTPRNAPDHPMLNLRRLTPDKAGHIWITAGTGLYVYDPKTGTLDEVQRNDGIAGKFYGIDHLDGLHRAYVFRDDGLGVFDPREQVYQPIGFGHLGQTGTALAFGATCDEESAQCLLSVSNGQGIYHLDPAARTWRVDPIPGTLRDEARSVTVSSISRLDDHTNVVCLNASILLYDARQRSYRPLPADLKVERSRFYNAYCDSRGNVWIATIQEGVRRWNSRSGVVTVFNVSSDPEFGAGNTETFFEDSKGRVWIKCRYALAWVDPDTDQLHHKPLKGLTAPFNAVYSEDPDGRIWIASLEGWIGRLTESDSPETDVVVNLGSPDNGVRTGIMDPDGVLWCLLKDKLIAYDTRRGQSTPYPFSREVRNHSLFNMTRLPDRRWLILSRDVVFLLDPEDALRPAPLPRPFVQGINIREAPFRTDTVARALRMLRLRPFENFFSIHFSAIGLRLDDGQTFRYRLKGFQDDWIVTEDRRLANFTNVPSGHYVFELQVVDLFTGREGETLILPVQIARRWIDKLWVRMILAVLFLAFVHAIYRYRVQQIRKEEKLKADFQEALAHAETDALRAQMNPHFIFNSLNSIEGYILRHDAEKAASYLNDFARLIRLILENSREKEIPLDRELETLRLYLEMESMRFSDRFSYRVNCDPAVQADEVRIPPMLIQPFVENAIWHGLMPLGGAGRVDVDVSFQEPGTLRVIVEDNGIGRTRSREINARKKTGDRRSLGMAITGDRLAMMNARTARQTRLNVVDLYDPDGKATGTRVQLLIPVPASAAEQGE